MAKEENKSPLSKLGLNTPADLALHLPIRYEDETELFDINTAIFKQSQFSVQTQGQVIDSQITFRPRRQLIIKIADKEEELILRFINFYPSQQRLRQMSGQELRLVQYFSIKLQLRHKELSHF